MNNDCTTDGDKVCDTPPKFVPSFGNGSCETPTNTCMTDEDDTSANNPYRAVALGGLGEQLDMFANYMDYTGSCWDAFTEGQKVRMKANITSNRMNLVNNSAACQTGTSFGNDAGITTFTYTQADECTKVVPINATLKNYGSNTLTSAEILVQLDGVTQVTHNWTGSLSPQAETVVTISPNLTFANADTSRLILISNLPNGVADENAQNDGLYYENINYIGIDGCDIYSDCRAFSFSTNSGPDNITKVSINASFEMADVNGDDVKLCVIVRGDISDPNTEYFNIKNEAGTIIGQTPNGVICGGPVSICLDVAPADYNNWIGDGTLFIDLDPVSTDINPFICVTSQACVNVYLPASSTCEVAGTASNVSVCENSAAINLFDQLTGESTGGIWSTNGGTGIGGSFNAETGSFTPNSITNPGTFIFRYTIAAAGVCSADTEDVTVTVNALPTMSLGSISHQACSPILVKSDTRQSPNNTGIQLEKEIVLSPSAKVYPNPMRHHTTIELSLPKAQAVQLDLYDLSGRKIVNLVNGTTLPEGVHHYEWQCEQVEAGMYLLALNGRIISKLVVIR